MSKPGNWIPLDKNLVQEFKFINRPFSRIEAMFSFTIDQDCEKQWSIIGYSKLWGWSRNKVRKFIKEIQGSGHNRDTIRTGYGHPVSFIDKDLWRPKDTIGTQQGHNRDTTNNPNSNPNKNIFAKLPLRGGKFFNVTEEQVKKWESLFKRINVREKILYITEYNTGLPEEKKKEASQMMVHISSWLNRDNEKQPEKQEWY